MLGPDLAATRVGSLELLYGFWEGYGWERHARLLSCASALRVDERSGDNGGTLKEGKAEQGHQQACRSKQGHLGT